MASKEVSLLKPWLIGHPSIGVLCRDELGVFNVGFCEVLDLQEASKGEVVTVGVALYSISNSFSFSGVSKRNIE